MKPLWYALETAWYMYGLTIIWGVVLWYVIRGDDHPSKK